MEENKDAPIESVRSMIIELVRSTWKEKGVGVLLSQIGAVVSNYPEQARAEMGSRKLSSYLEDVLRADVQVVVSPENPIVRVAVPADVAIPVDTATLFPRADPSKKAATATGVSAAILAAFSRPLAADRKRVVHLTPKARFEDIPVDADVPASAKVIERELIVDTTQSAESPSAQQLVANIARWRAKSEVRPETISPKAKLVERQGKRSLLERVIETLPEQDLKRIQLPLDIVEKLLNRF